jgi:hypothetical protein
VQYVSLLELAHPYAAQLMLIFSILLFLKKMYLTQKVITPRQSGFLALTLTIALWVNDSTFVFTIIIVGALLLGRKFGYLKIEKRGLTSFFTTLVILTTALLIRKFDMRDFSGYEDSFINPWPVFIASLLSWHDHFVAVFKSKSINILHWLFACLGSCFIILGLVFSTSHLFKRKPEYQRLFLPAILIITSSGLYILVNLSEWYIINYSGWQYLTSTYYMFFGGILILISEYRLENKIWAGILGALAFILTFIGFFTGFDETESAGFIIEDKKQLDQLSGAGVIGSYWFSYSVSAFCPDDIAATPHEGNFNRNKDEVDRTLARDTIYLVKNGWFEEYPDSIEQFGIRLHRISPVETIVVGNAEMSAYKKISE